MCGIIAVLRRPSTRAIPEASEILTLVGQAQELLKKGDLPSLAEANELLKEADHLLRGGPGLLAFFSAPELADHLYERLAPLTGDLSSAEEALVAAEKDPEEVNHAATEIRDALWALSRDRIGTYRGVCSLASSNFPPSPAGLTVLLSVEQALRSLDRLEVRGRDSAGLQITLWGHQSADLTNAPDALYRSGATHETAQGVQIWVVKEAAEIGELGDNTAALRKALKADQGLAQALTSLEVQGTVLGQTRWASMGVVSQANAHPLDSGRADDQITPLVTAVQNGDVDNHVFLREQNSLSIAAGITTDAKVVPALCAAQLAQGVAPTEAFRRTVQSFEGSLAIAASLADDPGRLYLSLRGSGQALYLGLGEDVTVVASEPYGLVEVTAEYLRMEGDLPADPDHPVVSRGQIIEIDTATAGTLEGIARRSFDERPLPVTSEELVTAEITTRDIDRGDHPHYLLKEVGEAPTSIRTTLRGHLINDPQEGWAVRLSSGTLNDSLRADLASGSIKRITVIGQGTAAIAAQSIAESIKTEVAGTGVMVEAQLASELSGFGLRPNMADTFVVAISQSGTTTDTNRTVDLARSRGARVVAIVNRRNSDLTDRADGVLYTSNGRDVEMSVASTKAFYAQIAAGFLLAVGLADALGAPGAADRSAVLSSLNELPEAMEQVLAGRQHIAEVAQRHAPPRRHWAIVGSGSNLIAAREIRIKLSELCYKSIASDSTEDKKHIDLSSEPMILVCAAGLVGSNADDVAKEVAIYQAHRAAPIVVCDTQARQYGEGPDLIRVPSVHPRLAFVLSTMVGHLFGYEAARAIDAQADPLRQAHAAIEKVAVQLNDQDPTEELLADLSQVLATSEASFSSELRSGRLNGHLEASTAVRLAGLFRYALGDVPLEAYQSQYGQVGTPGLVLDDLAGALTTAIEELTRPIDAIKHQAKTVTVGISRTDETLLEARLAQAVMAAGTPRDSLSYRTLRLLGSLDPAVVEVVGFTRYHLQGLATETPTLSIVDRGGVSTSIASRTDTDPVLRGTKHRVAVEREVLVTRGARDDRTLVLVPEVKDAETVGLTLLHVEMIDHLDQESLRGVLRGYHDRYAAIEDAVCETEPELPQGLLAALPVADLLIDPIGSLAERLRSSL